MISSCDRSVLRLTDMVTSAATTTNHELSHIIVKIRPFDPQTGYTLPFLKSVCDLPARPQVQSVRKISALYSTVPKASCLIGACDLCIAQPVSQSHRGSVLNDTKVVESLMEASFWLISVQLYQLQSWDGIVRCPPPFELNLFEVNA